MYLSLLTWFNKPFLSVFAIKMAEFTAVFVVEEDGSLDIKEECMDEIDPLLTTSQSTKGKRKIEGPS